MHKIRRTAGVSTNRIEIGGKTYTLRPLTVGTYAAMEDYVLSLRPDPLAELGKRIKSIPVEHHAAAWDAAMRQVVTGGALTAEELVTFERSIRGLAWKLWQLVKADHPEIDSVEKAINLVEEAGQDRLQELHLKMMVASGEADMGESCGQETETDPDPTGH